MDQPTLIALCLIAVAAGVLTSVVVTSGRSRRVLDRLRDEPALVVGAVMAQQAPVLGVRVDETGLSTPPSLPASFTIGTQNAGLIPYGYCS